MNEWVAYGMPNPADTSEPLDQQLYTVGQHETSEAIFLPETNTSIARLGAMEQYFLRKVVESYGANLVHASEDYAKLPPKNAIDQLAPQIFELYCWFYHSNFLRTSEVLTNPYDTASLVAAMNPIPHHPDGISLAKVGDKTFVAGLHEYTLSTNLKNVSQAKFNQVRRYNRGEFIHMLRDNTEGIQDTLIELLRRKYPHLLGRLQFTKSSRSMTYSFPKDGTSELINRFRANGVSGRRLPIYAIDIRAVADGLIRDVTTLKVQGYKMHDWPPNYHGLDIYNARRHME